MPTRTLWDRRSAPLVPPAPPGDEHWDDVVVGAGAVGPSAAAALARHGRRVLVVEAHDAVGEGTSARSTGKLSLLQATRLSSIERSGGTAAAAEWLDTCRDALEWVEGVLERHDVATQRRLSATWALKESEVDATRAEDATARRLGLATRWQAEVPGGAPGHGAVVLDDELQVDPLAYTVALARDALAAGAHLLTGRRVTSVSRNASSGAVVGLDDGSERTARQVLVATGIPVLDRSLAFAAAKPQRSYAVAFTVPQDFGPMMVSAGSPSVSLRGAPADDGTGTVVVGGFGHPVGRSHPAGGHVAALREWAHEHLPVGEELAVWSAQDDATPDSRPLVGRLPGSAPVHAVSGFGKWGLLAGVGQARRLAEAVIAGDELPRLPTSRLLGPRTVPTVLGWNAEVGAHMVGGWAGAAVRGGGTPPEGQGVVSRGVPPTATSTVDGCRRTVSGVCPHLGGVVGWNDVEKSWDCPLHASRFADSRNADARASSRASDVAASRPAGPDSCCTSAGATESSSSWTRDSTASTATASAAWSSTGAAIGIAFIERMFPI